MNVGIVGMGVVGKAIYAYHAEREPKIWCCDKRQDYENQLQALNENAEVVFVALPTPYAGVSLGLDCSAVYEAVGKLTGEKTIILKSTVMPGVTDDLQAKHPEHRFFFVPEFLSADTAVVDYAHPRRPHIIGFPGRPSNFGIVEDDHSWFTLMPGRRTVGITELPALQAELLKLATNAWYALKVSYANQLYDIGMEQATLDAMVEDQWIGNSHLTVMHKGYRGTSGACLTKDTRALNDYAFSTGKCYRRFMAGEVTEYNKRLLKGQGLEDPAVANR